MTVRWCMLPERTVGSNRKAEWKRTSGVEAENRRNETMNAQGKDQEKQPGNTHTV